MAWSSGLIERLSKGVGEAVLCKVRGRIMLHKVTSLRDGQVQISNNHGHVNGTKTENVFGRLIRVEP